MRKLILIVAVILFCGSFYGQATFSGVTLAPNETSGFSQCGVSYQTWDTFTGTNGTALTSHTDNCGYSWISYNGVSGDANNLTLNGSRGTVSTTNNGNGNGGAYNSLTPVSANYTEYLLCTPQMTVAVCEIWGRASTSVYTAYGVVYISGTGVLCGKYITGAFTQLGSTLVVNWTNYSSHLITLGMIGTTITCTSDGITVFSGTDASISAAGVAGIRSTGSSSMYLSNFEIK